jgi:hypothetical protein
LTKEIRRGSNSTTTVYPIRVVSKGRGSTFSVGEELRYEEGRKIGEQIASFLNAPLSDSASGKTVVRNADELDISIKEQAKRNASPEPLPSTPPVMRSRIREDRGGVVVEIPAPKTSPATVLNLVMPLIFVGIGFFLFRDFVTGVPLPPVIKYGITGVLVVFIIVVPVAGIFLKTIHSKFAGSVVTANNAFLRVERGLDKKKGAEEIPVDAIEEFEIVEKHQGTMTDRPDGGTVISGTQAGNRARIGSTGNEVTLGPKASALLSFLGKLSSPGHIVARSDEKTITFGQGLEPEELRYLHGVVRKALVG